MGAPTELDRLFGRWTQGADIAALGELFDGLAPGLFRAAIHLVGDAARAEDLVQSVFLMAIERRETIDPGAPAMAWALRVLHSKVVDARRRDAHRSSSALGLDDLAEPTVAAPGEAIEKRELEGQVAAAIDALGPPYREVLLARFRHGASAGEIAHLLGRSPGQVRVQLHRGLAMLRERLPKDAASGGFAFAAAWIAPGTRGLDAVRESVLAAGSEAIAASAATVSVVSIASATSGTSATAALSGYSGALIMKKTLFVAAALALALVAIQVARPSRPADSPPPLSQGQAEVVLPRATLDSAALSELGDGPGTGRAAAAETPVLDASGGSVTGRVVRFPSGDPVAGALVRSLAPRRLSPVDAARAFPELVELGWTGKPGPAPIADWPTVGDIRLGNLARHGGFGERVLAEARTGADGSFEIPMPDAGRGLLEFSAQGLAPRFRPVEPAPFDMGEVELFMPRTLSGQLLGDDMQPVALPLLLSVVSVHDVGPPALGPIDVTRRKFVDAQVVRADASGAYSAIVAGPSVRIHVIDPEWKGQGSETSPSFQVHRQPCLLITDAETGAPIETFDLLLESRHSAPWTGRHLAPGGLFRIGGVGPYFLEGAPFTISAWADGYGITKVTVGEIKMDSIIPLALRAGSLPDVAGRITNGGEPCAGASIALNPAGLYRWGGPHESSYVATVETDASGGYQLALPEGRYVFVVEQDGLQAKFLARVPSDEPIDFDFSICAAVEVQVDMANAGPDVKMYVQGDAVDGRNVSSELTGTGTGNVRFEGLMPGEYRFLVVPMGASRPDPDAIQTVHLGPGEERRLNFEVAPPPEPQAVRVTRHGTLDYSTWQARPGGRRWFPVDAAGNLPFQTGRSLIVAQVDDGDGMRYEFEPSKDGSPTELTRGDGVYAGLLLDASGAPMDDVWIAHSRTGPPSGARSPWLRSFARTDAQGRFRLEGLPMEPCSLRLRTHLAFEQPNTKNGLNHITVTPSSLPGSAAAPTLVTIVAHDSRPEEGRIAVSGTVLRAGGAGVPKAMARLHHIVPTEGGTVTTHVGGSLTDERGGFTLRVPPGLPCTLKVYSDPFGSPYEFTEQSILVMEGESPAPLSIVVPDPTSPR